MVSSVKDKGVTQPAIVRPREDGGYEIVSGHRRQKASELAGFTDMPCIIRNLTDGHRDGNPLQPPGIRGGLLPRLPRPLHAAVPQLPRPLHHAVPVSAERFGKFLEGAKFPDSFGSASAIAVYVGLGYIKGFRIFRFRCRYFHVVFPPYSVSLYIATENLTKKYRLYAACGYFLRYGAVKDPSTLF